MTLLVALIIWLVFFIALMGAFYAGWLVKGKQHSAHLVEVDEDKKRKQEQLYEGFQAVMSYDVETALQRKKVTHD